MFHGTGAGVRTLVFLYSIGPYQIATFGHLDCSDGAYANSSTGIRVGVERDVLRVS